jgi:hypothetical protein
VLRCQAQLQLTLMMCLSDRSTSTGALSDRSTFTSTDARAKDLRHRFFWRSCCRLGACVFARAQALSPPIFSNITHIRTSFGMNTLLEATKVHDSLIFVLSDLQSCPQAVAAGR